MGLPSLSIVIPAYNEEARLGRTLDEIRAYLGSHPIDWEVRVVDDGSADGTAGIVAAAGAREPRVVLQREPHRGKGAAVRAGMIAARGDVRFLCDADLSMPIDNLDRFLLVVPGQYDIAIGSRELPGANRIGEPAHRHLMGRVFNQLTRLAGVHGIEDTQCGFKLFSAAAAEAIFRRVTLDGWAFDVEVLVIARALGFSIKEVPIDWHYRAASRISPARDTIRMAKDVLRVRRNRARGIYKR